MFFADIEDFALGYLQQNIKLFLFGQAHKALGAFESKIEQSSELQHQQENVVKGQAAGNRGGGAGSGEVQVTSRPAAIKFP